MTSDQKTWIQIRLHCYFRYIFQLKSTLNLHNLCPIAAILFSLSLNRNQSESIGLNDMQYGHNGIIQKICIKNMDKRDKKQIIVKNVVMLITDPDCVYQSPNQRTRSQKASGIFLCLLSSFDSEIYNHLNHVYWVSCDQISIYMR